MKHRSFLILSRVSSREALLSGLSRVTPAKIMFMESDVRFSSTHLSKCSFPGLGHPKPTQRISCGMFSTSFNRTANA